MYNRMPLQMPRQIKDVSYNKKTLLYLQKGKMKGIVCGAYHVTARKSRVTRVINVGSRHFSKGDDVVFFHIYLAPFVATGDTITVCYANGSPLYTLRVTGEPPKQTLSMGQRTFDFYPTYQVERLLLAPENGGGGVILYLTLENNRISFDDEDTAPLIEPHVDLQTSVPGVSFTQLPFLPLHPYDPLLEGQSLHQMPQRVPTWYVARSEGDISGSSVNKYAGGYWLDDKEWSARSDSLMRFGRLNEMYVQLIAMYNHQKWTFEECGTYCFQDPCPPLAGTGLENSLKKAKIAAADAQQQPQFRFKASPDCLARVPGMTWDIFPVTTRKRFENEAEPDHMVMEYKASYTSTAFPDYYIPQLYWEMMATRSAQACLIRYKRRRQMDGEGRWVTSHEAMEYHIFRDPAVEDMILRNVHLSMQRPTGMYLKDWVAANFVFYQELQHVLKGIVNNTKGRALQIPKELLEKAYKERCKYL